MSSKEKEGSVTSNDGDDKKMKEDLQDDMQVLDEVTENDDGTGYGDEDILEGDEHIGDEEAEYLEAEDDLGEEELVDEDLAEEGDDELHEELADEANVSATDGEKPADDGAAAPAEGEEEGKEDDAKSKKEGEQKADDKDARRSTRDGREYRERLFLPNYKSFKIDLKIAAKVRSVIAGPLDLEDLQDEKVREIINQAEEFFIRFHRTEENKCTGHVQFRFATFEEATASVEKIEKIKEGLTVKQLVGGLNVEKITQQMTAKQSADGANVGRVDKLIRGVDDDIDVPADTVKNLVSVCGIPTTTTKEQLAELFPQARIKLMAMKANGTPKGYCYIELDDEEAAKKLVEEHNAKPHVIDGHKLYLEKMQAPLELFMVIDSDDVLTEEERAKIVRTLNMSQMQLDRRGSRMKTKEYHDLIRKVRMMKQKLAIDNRKRREKGMSLPKPPMRRPMGASSRAMYPMSRPRGMGPRPSRPDMRPRREAMSPRSSVRSPVSRNRPAHRMDERYHSGHGLRSPSPRGEGYYGQSPNSRRDLGPPRRMDSDRGGRFGTSDRGRFNSDRGSSRYGSGDRGRSGKLNTHQTANAVNMLVGLTSLLSEMQRKPPAGGGGGGSGGGPERRHSSTGGQGASSSGERWQTSYSERSRPRTSDYGGSYGTSSSSFRESSSSYRDDWGSSRSESLRTGGGGGSGGHSSYDDAYYEDRGTRKRTMSDRGGYDDDYYGRSERGGLKRSKIMSRGRGGGPRGRY